jgi:hypothetical protein
MYAGFSIQLLHVLLPLTLVLGTGLSGLILDCVALPMQGKSRDVFNRLGTFAWLAAAILGAEIMNIAKLGRGEFTAPFPEHIKLAWSIAAGGLVIFLAVWQTQIWVSNYLQKASPMVPEKEKGKMQ